MINKTPTTQGGATSGFTTRDRMGEKFAKGGSIRGGGIESRGKTKGRMV